jgi:DNA-binding MarR family transcriptional regulator
LQPKSSQLLHEIEETARELRHEILETISPRDLQICLRVLSEIRQKAAAAGAHAGNGHRSAKIQKQAS